MSNSKIAILIDGGFFTQRFKQINGGASPVRKDVEALIKDIYTKVQAMTASHSIDLLRTFYYDCRPFEKIITTIKGKKIDCSQSKIYGSQMAYLNDIKMIDQFALRLGELSFAGWRLSPFKPNPAKVIPDFRQKGVDMKIGLDMAWMAGKKSVDKMVLVTGDSDFISPIKLVRREGILVYLHPMGSTTLKSELKEHSDFILI